MLPQLLHELEDPRDDLRRESERGLVEEQQLRPRHERACDGELLLLAAREQAGEPVAELSEHREEADDPLPVLPVTVAGSSNPAPRRRFSSTVIFANTRRPSGQSAIPLVTRRSGERRVMSRPS